MKNEAGQVTTGLLRGWSLPDLQEADKEDRGQVLVLGGAVQTPGAVLLAATAALRCGAGKLQIATARTTALMLAVAVPEAFVQGLPETPGGAVSAAGADLVIELADSAQAVLVG